ncbi:endo-b-N-acetylglucosaminidase [Halteromyces radiatus]|uniref:endo-b-N-acetylglucosaminidase n=1 Tax=Halteromyces radiatus TaxID=101107 RepID=UPI00221ED2C2|nr:endo-b-N-acetylglucosaminidase [Halteromyces radiatus]KAI8092805.1 endo-b-N-acetylglucosaminidase [Halteromyces radiatus]
MPSLPLQQINDEKLFKSHPLSSMEELKNWNPNQMLDNANIASIKLRKRPKDTTIGSKLLLCHDMAGGYKEDEWVQGNNYETIYHVQYWQYVDTFIYFSHERVTIPPVNWINACHRNGISCLGTFIVENDQMHELEQLLHGPLGSQHIGKQDDDPMRLWSPYFADKLVAIAKHYGFDGWLMNIECSFMPFPTPAQYKTQQFLSFLDYFREKLHQAIPDSILLWYDSLTIDGELDWQDQLNDKNLPFFKVTDGIFLNYGWKENYPKEASKLATTIDRNPANIYFGTDVWGRGTFGGGGFNSYKGVTTSMKSGTSSALFGTAWTYEHFEQQNFDTLDRLFWKGGPVTDFPSEFEDITDSPKEYHPGTGQTIRRPPSMTWFFTSFDQGCGKNFYFHGKKLLTGPWSHLSHQSIPGSMFDLATLDGNDAYIGGSSVILHCSRPTTNSHTGTFDHPAARSFTGLFQLSLKIKSPRFQLCYSYKSLPDANGYNYSLTGHLLGHSTTDGINSQSISVLDHEGNDGKHHPLNTGGLSIIKIREEAMINGWIIRKVDIDCTLAMSAKSTLVIQEIGFIISIYSATNVKRKVLNTNKEQQVIVSDTTGMDLDMVRLGSVSIIGEASALDYSISDNIITTSTPCFSWTDVQWEKLDYDNNGNPIVRFWGTINWCLSANNEISDQKQQRPLPEWRQTEYTLVFLSCSTLSDDNDIFIGSSFSTLYRISGIDIHLGNSLDNTLMIQYVDALGDIQSTHRISLPRIDIL